MRSLLYAVNLGSIDLHPFISRYNKVENPDYCVIDLDPHDIPFEKVTEAALLFHEMLEKIGVTTLLQDIRRQRAASTHSPAWKI